ncbi:MAG TPA: hypothetical protein VK841_16155 [Polyangiaceae bacterium]|jgi:hypothetical protein|nr:hypothetical protein [Polyangiaceae bacterium]
MRPEPELESHPRRVRARTDEPTPLRDLVATAAEAEARLHAAEADYALRMAAVARAARRGGATDNSAARACASALGITRQTLQPYALLGMRWTPAELRSLLERQDCHGRRVSLSHLLILSRLSHTERCRRTEEVFAEGLGVHELRRRIRASQRQAANLRDG